MDGKETKKAVDIAARAGEQRADYNDLTVDDGVDDPVVPYPDPVIVVSFP